MKLLVLCLCITLCNYIYKFSYHLCRRVMLIISCIDSVLVCAADMNTMLPLKTCGPKKIHLGQTAEFSGRI